MSATAQNGLQKYIPGLILCVILGWLALQWDYSMRGWQKDFKESQKILKSNADHKPPLLFDKYKDKQGTLKKGPKKPHILRQDIYESLIAAREIPFKFKFGNKMLEFQLTYVAILLLGGMLIRNTIGIPDSFKPGTVLARPIIKPGIVLLGGYYVWSNLFLAP